MKAGLEEGDYWREKTMTFGFNHNAEENVTVFIFSVNYF